MGVLYDLLKDHIGHRVEIAQYGNGDNFALEDLDTDEVIFDTDLYELTAKENNMSRIATNIQWDIYLDEAYEALDSLSRENIAKMFGDKTLNMTTSELHDYCYEIWHRCPAELDEFMGLPDSVRIPDGLEDDEIADYISDEYGFCISGFDI